jgi:transposase
MGPDPSNQTPTDARGKPRVGESHVISGNVHILESGWRWGDDPDAFGPRKTFYNQLVR